MVENGGNRGKSGKNIIMNKEYAKSNPIVVDDFKVLISECYYVDKNKLIEEIVNKGS